MPAAVGRRAQGRGARNHSFLDNLALPAQRVLHFWTDLDWGCVQTCLISMVHGWAHSAAFLLPFLNTVTMSMKRNMRWCQSKATPPHLLHGASFMCPRLMRLSRASRFPRTHFFRRASLPRNLIIPCLCVSCYIYAAGYLTVNT